MEKKEIMDSLTSDGIFRFSVEESDSKKSVECLRNKGINVESSAEIILARSAKTGLFKRIFSFKKKNDKKTIKIAVLDSEHISGIGTKHTAEDVFETAGRLRLLNPTPNLIFSVLEKFDAESFIQDMGLDRLVFLHRPIRVKGNVCVLDIHLSAQGCSYKANVGATYFFPKRKWEEKTGFVFIIG